MTKIFNDPAEFADEQLQGFLSLHSDQLSGVMGGVIAHRTDTPQVAVVIGGGSGHYPAFCGTVGTGFATGAVVGNIFTSPSTAQAYSVARAADQGKGVVLSFGNYAGDNINFGLAAKRLNKEGIDTRVVVVTDDVASAEKTEQRRGIAGDFTVFKVMGAAAAAGKSLDEVQRLGDLANDATRSLGVAFSGCTMPGSTEPLFTVPKGYLGLGLGIHGEPGIEDIELMPAPELAHLLVSHVLRHAPRKLGGKKVSKKVAPILNGLGTTKYEELFLLWSMVSAELIEKGYELVQPEVGELVTSLDMGGCSLTLMWLDEELEPLWRADAYTPAYRKVAAATKGLKPAAVGQGAGKAEKAPKASAAARTLAGQVRAAVTVMDSTLRRNESELARIDAVAGDGDHGRGMVKGIAAASARAKDVEDAAGAGWLLRRVGMSWAEQAGGTSGVLWGGALEAFGTSLGDDGERYGPAEIAAAVEAFAESIQELGQANLGDKTMLDSLLPFAEDLRAGVEAGTALAPAWQHAAQLATSKAEQTAQLRPRIGRARPLAERSVGTPDAGATSMALLVTALGDWLEKQKCANETGNGAAK